MLDLSIVHAGTPTSVSPDENFEKAPSWTPKCATDAPPFVIDAPIFFGKCAILFTFYCIFINNFLPNFTFLAKKFVSQKFSVIFLAKFTRKKNVNDFLKRKKMNKSFFNIFVRFRSEK